MHLAIQKSARHRFRRRLMLVHWRLSYCALVSISEAAPSQSIRSNKHDTSRTPKPVITMCKTEEIPKEFQLIDRYWKASNYLAVGQVRTVQLELVMVRRLPHTLIPHQLLASSLSKN